MIIKNLNPDLQSKLDRFITVCQEDDRIRAAFLGGSFASGTADRYSDLDLFLIITDPDYDDFISQRETWIQQFGKPGLSEDFDYPGILLVLFEDGTDVDFIFGKVSRFLDFHKGPHTVLVDKDHILAGVSFPGYDADAAGQMEKLRRSIYWFWHDFVHFLTAMRRGQIWWAQGQLEALRQYCVNLARLEYNFLDDGAGGEPYFKIERALPVERLKPLEATFGPMDKETLLKSSLVLLRFYREHAMMLAQAHGMSYPDVLERVLGEQLEELGKGTSLPARK